MPQENLNKIWKAGKLFEEPKPEQPTKEPTPDETKHSNVKRRINVAKAFMPTQEDPFKKKVEAVMKGIEEEPAPAPATVGKEEKPVPDDVEVIDGTGQHYIGERLVTGKSIHVEGDAGSGAGNLMFGGGIYIKGNAGNETGNCMSGGEIHVEGNTGNWTGCGMSGGILRVDGEVASFGRRTFVPTNRGTIIWKGKTIWKDGQKEEPGWTNLNVKRKIAK
jgi:glutamate synthase domain-containing protein 3